MTSHARFITSGFILALLMIIPVFAKAMEVRPASMEVSINPGGTEVRAIQIRNNDQEVRTYYLQIQKFLPRGEQGQQEFLAFDDIQGLPSWTYLSQSSITLQPNETRSISVTLRIPENVAPGGYYEAVFVSSAPIIQGQAPTAFRTGVLFFVGVNGAVTKRISLTDMELLVPTRLAHPPVAFRYTLENQGGIHLSPSGFLTVRNWRGRMVDRSPLNVEQAYILPASRRQFIVFWKNNDENEITGTFWSEVRKEWKGGLFGPYRLRIELDNGEAQRGTIVRLSEEVRIFIWPWHLFLVVGGCGFFVLVLLRMYRAHVLRRAIQNQKI